MSGTRRQFVDYSNNTNNDTGENTAGSILPIADGEGVTGSNLSRGGESLRQRSEAARDALWDSQYLLDADRKVIITGPGKVSWTGSTTAASGGFPGADGIPVISDTLWVLPMLTPGFAQTAPVPPVASAFGVIHLKRADSLDSILVTSMRRSYAAGDRISIVVSAGSVFSCTLDTETGYSRTIKIVATGSTTLTTVINALNALLPPAPDNTQLVNAALEGGAAGTDLILTSQAKQFMSGNYDGEGHTITPANLAAFFAGNPTQALAEGDSLCVSYAMVSDTASTGGRRQSIPENSNTAIPSGSFFNSRVHPENLVNAIPICKVVNGALVFGTGVEVPAGSVDFALSSANTLSAVLRNGDFEHGVTAGPGATLTRYDISDWENRGDLAVNGSFVLRTTPTYAGGKALIFTRTSNSAATARIEQELELPVTPTQKIVVEALVRQLIAPTAGTYAIIMYWGDADSAASSSTSTTFQVLSTTDANFRYVKASVAVPSGKRFLKTVTVEVAAVTAASTGDALAVDSLQVYLENATSIDIPATSNTRLRPQTVDAVLIEDPVSFSVGQLAALLRYDRTTPSGEGTLKVERKDQTYDSSHLPPALAMFGRILSLGSKLLATETDSVKPRIDMPYSTAASTEYTLLWQSERNGESSGGYTQPVVRIWADTTGGYVLTVNAVWGTTTWSKDVNGTAAFQMVMKAAFLTFSFQDASANTAWADNAWTQQFFKIDQVAALATIHNANVVSDSINFDNPVMQVTGNTQQGALLLAPADGYSQATVGISPNGMLLHRGSRLFEEFWGNALDTNRWLESSAGAGSTGINTDTHEYFMTTGTTSGNFQQINSRNYGAYKKNRPRFSARLRTNNLNPTNILGNASGVLVGYANLYLIYDQTIHASTHWYLHSNGTDYDTGLTANLDGTAGNSAGQIVYFAVVDDTHVHVIIHDQNDSWVVANQAKITVASIPTGPFQALAAVTNRHTTDAPTLYVDFIDSQEVTRKD